MPADQCPSPWVQAAISGMAALHPPDSRIRYTAVLFNHHLFVDDTGTHDGATFCGAAGYLFTGEDAAAFSQEWCDALPADLRDGGFGFSRFVRDVQRRYRDPEALRPLVDVLRRRARCGVNYLMRMECYSNLPGKYRAFIGDPWRFCLLQVLKAMLQELGNLSDLDPAERLVTIANFQPGREGRTLTLWNLWVKQLGVERRVEPIVFRHTRDFPGLQGADLLAHTAYRVVNGPPPWPGLTVRPSLPISLYSIIQPFLTGPKPVHTYGLVTEDVLRPYFPAFDAIMARTAEGPPDSNDPIEAMIRKREGKLYGGGDDGED